MPLPWLAALGAIPWRAILQNAPAIVRSADALLSGTKRQGAPPGPTSEAHSQLADRVTALEQRDRETAELLARVARQLEDLTAATEQVAMRARWALMGAISALVLGIVAAGLAIWLR